jgi:ABC-2 type transport system permease protein
MQVIFRQAIQETRLLLRRREVVIFSLLLPVLFLAFFGALYGGDTIPHSNQKYIDYIVPGYAVYAVMAVALGTLCANIATERQFGILKRLGGTPLPRSSLIGAKIIAGALMAGGVIVVLVLVGIIGYHIHLLGNQLEAIGVLAIGILTFAAMGIALGGVIKPDSAVAAGSLLYLTLSFLGGVFIPSYQFGSVLRTISDLLPSGRMVDAMQSIWTHGHGLESTGWDIPVMLIWAIAALILGARWFHWE